MKCLNCGTECNSEYCPRCGQKTSTQRFQVGEILLNVITSIIGGDNKLLGTCKNLVTRPGYMIREYILGKRVCYYSPMPLLVSLVAIYAIATYFFTDAMSPFDVFVQKPQQGPLSSSYEEVFLSYYQMIIGNTVYFAIYSVILNLIPYRMVFGKLRLARPTGTSEPLNVAEHFVALTYQVCFNMILAFLLIPFSLIEACKTMTAWICFTMPMIYCFIIYKQMLDISWVKSIWLNIKAVILSMIISVTIIMLIMGILAGIEHVQRIMIG